MSGQTHRARARLGLLAFFLAAAAAARQPDGTLAIIQTPNNGIPAIVIPGGVFDAVLTQRADLKLAGKEPAPAVTIEWTNLPGGRARAHCTVAADAVPGAYALEAAGGDRNERAVFVVAEMPDTYLVAHLTDTHVGSIRETRPAADIFRDAMKAANDAQPAFVIVTGDLTDDGEMEQFREFLDILDTCAAPTFVCPGNHDRKGLNYETVFGPTTYMFRFGPDGYLSFDTKDFIPADELLGQDGDLEVYRRAIRSARWSIGLTHRIEPTMGMRCPIALFVDDPLDHVIFGHWHRANTESEKTVPWGNTRMTVTPATADGFIRLFEISGKGIKAREPQRVVAMEPPKQP